MRPLRHEGSRFVIATGVCPTDPDHEVRIRAGRETWTCTVCTSTGDDLPPPEWPEGGRAEDTAMGLLRSQRAP